MRSQCVDCGAILPAVDVLEGGDVACAKCGTVHSVERPTPRDPMRLLERAARERVTAEARWLAAVRHAGDLGYSARDVAKVAGVAHTTVARIFREDAAEAIDLEDLPPAGATARGGRASMRPRWTEPTLEGVG